MIQEVTSNTIFNCENKRLQCYNRWKIFFDRPIENYLKTYENIRKIATGQGDDYTT